MVQPIQRAVPPPELDLGDQPLTRISIFLNIFNVHVNRVPVDGTITALAYRPGKFVNAALDKASEDNERMALKVTTYDGVRSEERRVGQECVSTCRSGWSLYR